MELLAVYEDKDEAEDAESKVTGPHRLASDRDDNQVVYRLFATPSWANFYALEMYELPRLKELIDQRKAGETYDLEEHERLITGLGIIVNTYSLMIPEHWL